MYARTEWQKLQKQGSIWNTDADGMMRLPFSNGPKFYIVRGGGCSQ